MIQENSKALATGTGQQFSLSDTGRGILGILLWEGSGPGVCPDPCRAQLISSIVGARVGQWQTVGMACNCHGGHRKSPLNLLWRWEAN